MTAMIARARAPKPRNACFKDSAVAYLALKAQFAIADDYPSDTNVPLLGKLMLQHDALSNSWKGEYYEACKLFLSTNQEEMQRNALDMDKLLRAQPAIYWTGEKLWRKASDHKRALLNEFHTVFCQEVSPAWPMLPSGKSMTDLMVELRKKMFLRKAQELKDEKVKRVEKKVLDARKVIETLQASDGLPSETYDAAEKCFDSVLKELQIAKDEEPAEYDALWHPTLWKAYEAFGPSADNPHGYGGFLASHNGTCMTAGPNSPEADCMKSPNGGGSRAVPPPSGDRNRAHKDDGGSSMGEGDVGSSSESTEIVRIVSAIEASVAVMTRPVMQAHKACSCCFSQAAIANIG
jgi:hypothetical protein